MSRKNGKNIICLVCNKSFYVQGCRIKSAKYCSYRCFGIHKKRLYKGKNNPFYGKHHPKGFMKKIGKKISKTLKKMRFNFREKNPMWKGGRYKHLGYWYILMPNHPNAKINGYIKQSRYIMEQKLNRLLNTTERVHHINSIKDDDSPENLQLMKNYSEHTRFHNLNTKIYTHK